MNGNEFIDQYIRDGWHDPEFRAVYEEVTKMVEENVGRILSDTPVVAELKAIDQALKSQIVSQKIASSG